MNTNLMSKKNISIVNVFQNILIFILFSFYFWLTGTSQINILNIIHSSILLSIVITVFNIVLHFFYLMFLIVCFTKNSCFFSKEPIFNIYERLFERFCIKKIVILLSVRIVFDVLVIFATHTFAEYSYILSNVLLVGYWIFTYYYLTDVNTRGSKKSQGLVVLILILLLTVFVCIDLYYISVLNDSIKRYLPFSNTAMQMSLNYDFLFQLRSVALNILLGIVLYVSHIIKFKINKSNCSSFFVQLIIICVVFCMSFALRIIISGYNCVSGLNIFSSSGSTIEKDKYINNYNELTVKRITFDSTVGYQKTFHSIKLNGKTVKRFSEITHNNQDYSFEIDGVKVSVFADSCICFLENSESNVILYEDLGSVNENEIITKTIKELFYDGNLSVIEYGYNYLMKHEPEFIQPIIQSLKNGIFTSEQLSYIENNNYDKNYFVDFANRITKTQK